MAEFDAISKDLIQTYPHDFARFALAQDDVEVLEVLDTEQPTIETHRMDSLMRVRLDGTEALVHNGLIVHTRPCRYGWLDTLGGPWRNMACQSIPMSST